MLLEQEVRSMIIVGFIIVLAIVVFALFLLWNKTRNNGLLWFLPQLVMLSISLYFFLQLIDNQTKIDPVMLSEENSLSVGFIGLSWGLSMIFMVLGINSSIKKKISTHIKKSNE